MAGLGATEPAAGLTADGAGAEPDGTAGLPAAGSAAAAGTSAGAGAVAGAGAGTATTPSGFAKAASWVAITPSTALEITGTS